MDYAVIACNVASLAGFIGFIIDRAQRERPLRTRWFVGAASTITVAWWLWFYLWPANPVRAVVHERLEGIRAFDDNGAAVDTVEGRISVGHPGTYRVLTPPFAIAPDVTVVLADPTSRVTELPDVARAERDFFELNVRSTGQSAEYWYRARGRLLRPVSELTANPAGR